MKNRLEERLKIAIETFTDKVLSELKAQTVKIPEPGNTFKSVDIKNGVQLSGELRNVCRNKNIDKEKSLLVSHFNELRNYLSISSSPQAFKAAWDMKSSSLNSYDVEAITSLGGQIIPMNRDSRVLKYEQQGVLYGAEQRLILGVRHSEGNYDDDLDDLGKFSYQPPANVSGMLRYRYLQHLSKHLEIDLPILVIMWFEYRISNDINHVFLVAPAKVIKFEGDLKDLNASIQNPLSLQLIQRSEAYAKIDQVFALNQDDSEIDSRSELNINLAREFSYDKIKGSEKGRMIKRWAANTNKKCPGTLCNHTSFNNLNLSKIAFGHIVSQQWSSAFPHLHHSVNHPDNLYLTCNRCNSSLLDYFPDGKLRNEILKTGTIGDWLRKNEINIRKA